MLNSCPSRLHLWPAKRNWALKMKHLVPQFPSVLAIYCFCMLQIPSSVGFPRPLADPPDGLDVMQLERLAYWATLSRQLKFLFHYSRTQKLTQPVKSGDSGTATVDFTKKDHIATWGRPFFLFRPRNGRNMDDNAR
ncbi:neuromedin-S isoform X11 [Callorhinus ursinus]|uniref:neuromedin-S isoform X11 n=1 Tax=Callorhinus ursinus TaxID=34884 RepID=UPI003CD0281E